MLPRDQLKLAAQHTDLDTFLDARRTSCLAFGVLHLVPERGLPDAELTGDLDDPAVGLFEPDAPHRP